MFKHRTKHIKESYARISIGFRAGTLPVLGQAPGKFHSSAMDKEDGFVNIPPLLDGQTMIIGSHALVLFSNPLTAKPGRQF